MRPFLLLLALVARVRATAAAPTTSLGHRCASDVRPQQTGSCNVCLECCHDYISAEGCDSCVAAMCENTMPWPEADWKAPRIHYAPQCLNGPSWHDVAGALTYDGLHHVFQGCVTYLGGWHHAVSTDMVHWEEKPGAPRRIQESWYGMESFDTPCSGYVTLDDEGIPCAGFRQCGSAVGVTGGTGAWDAPMEIRCARDANLTDWGEPEELFFVHYNRWLPYDPARPWKENGTWYMLVCTDGCNGTDSELPCDRGYSIDMWSSPWLRGPKKNWTFAGTMYNTRASIVKNANITREIMTLDYIGGLPGDPLDGQTRVLLTNMGGSEGCCTNTLQMTVGRQANGGEFTPITSAMIDGMWMMDWGSFFPGNFLNLPHLDTYGNLTGNDALRGDATQFFSMARTLGSEDPNSVAKKGRRVAYGWVMSLWRPSASAMSLGRDLSLNGDFEILQQFVPELKALRGAQSLTSVQSMDDKARVSTVSGQQLEIVADFKIPGGLESLPERSEFGIAVLGCPNSFERTTIGVNPQAKLFTVDATRQANSFVQAGPLVPEDTDSIHIHAYIDHSIMEVILNNRTAITSGAKPRAASCGQVWLYGVDGVRIVAEMNVWQLATANNADLRGGGRPPPTPKGRADASFSRKRNNEHKGPK